VYDYQDFEQASARQQLLAESGLDLGGAIDTEEDDDVDESQPLAVQTTTRTHRTTETTFAATAAWDGVRLCDLSATMSGSLFES